MNAAPLTEPARSQGTRPKSHETSARGLLLNLVALLVLASLSFGLRFAHLGVFGVAVALAIAAMKAALVLFFFMEIMTERVAARLALVTGFALVALLLALALGDIVTRDVSPAGTPPTTAPRDVG